MQKIVALFLICFSITGPPIYAQNTSTYPNDSTIVNLSEYDSTGKPIQLENMKWKFNPGHDPKWADSDYDDSDWYTLSPQTDSLLAVKDSLWKGHGWFRLTFTVDSTFYQIPRALDFDAYGAAEIYIDGHKVDTYGMPALSHSKEILPSFLPTLYPSLSLSPSEEHVLAVRYSFHHYEKLKKLSYSGNVGIGFSIHIHRTEEYLSEYRSDLKIDLSYLISLVILLMITLLHLAFYIRFPSDKDNFWVFLITLHLFIVIGLLFQYRFVDVKGMLSIGTAYLMSYAFFQFCCMIPIALSNLLKTKNRSSWKYLSAAGVPIAAVHFLIMKLGGPIAENFANVVPVLLLMVILTLGTIIIWDAKKGKRENIWIIALGFLTLPILSLVTIVILVVTLFGFGPSAVDQLVPYLMPAVSIISFLSLPVCMSVYVGNMFFELYDNLEFQVEKRTQELHEKNEKLEEANQEIQQQRDEVAEARDNLENALHELEATQEQLVQQEKLASLGQLTAGIAHEIKNPLNFVNNFSELSVELVEEAREELLAVSGQSPEEATEKSPFEGGGSVPSGEEPGDVQAVQEALEILDSVETNLKKINEHGDRADGIVKSMLQHSRGGDGEREPTDLNALVEEYVDLAYHGMRASEHPINLEIQKDLDEAVGDVPLVAEDFSRVIINLCNNAFDAMRKKLNSESGRQNSEEYQPELTVRTYRNEESVIIEIEDNGPGIPEDVRDKIMQPFYTTKEGTEGTGLGLSITNDIVKAHGGDLEIESKGGEGAKFRVSI